jgi:hypothetical protein
MNLKKPWFRHPRPLGLLFLLAACAGCGSGLVTVEGDVTFDGQPVEQGTIVFEPADGAGPSAGGSIEAGAYRLSGESGVAPGNKTVRITATRKTGRQIEAGPPQPPGTMVDETETVQQTFTREVTAGGAGRHDFELSSP